MNKIVIFKYVFACLLSFYNAFSFAATDAVNSAAPSIPKNAQLLFIQSAKSGEIKAVKDEKDTYVLTLHQVDPHISYFTETPNRITGFIPSKQFFKVWQSQNNSDNKPNVAIETSDVKNGARIHEIFELTNPVVDTKTNTIKYRAKVLNGKEPSKLSDSTKLGYTVLFIDDFNWGGNIFGGN